MSRCFPFPTPGYDKKIRSDETDLLAKERRKEKKHRKDKTDKEKKESKERSKEKSKEKKDKKEKHRAKKDQDRDKEKDIFGDGTKAEVRHANGKGSNSAANTLQNNSNGDSKHIEELARRIRDEEKATEMKTVLQTKIADQRYGELPGRIGSYSLPVSQGNGNREDQKEIRGEINSQRKFTVSQTPNYSISQKFSSVKRKTVNGFAKVAETNKIQQSWDGKKSAKARDDNREHDGESDTRAEGNMEQLNEVSKEQYRFVGREIRSYGRSMEPSDTQHKKHQDLLGSWNKIPPGGGNLGKRKQLEINGILNDHEGKPGKLRRLASFHTVVEPGTKLEPQTPVSASERNGAAPINSKPIKERMNGFSMAAEPEVFLPSALFSITQVNNSSSAPTKAPHPDTEYLRRILLIPKVDDLPDLDDQEWLCGRDYVRLKSPNTFPCGSDGRRQEIWDKALRIESADVLALPYVIPY